MLRLGQVGEILGAPLHGSDRAFRSVSTDTRTLQPGALFVALQGPHFDGHAFIGAARDKGAVGALVGLPQPLELPWIQVEDTRLALGRLAAAWRERKAMPVVAVTGSNGKTTVKEMLAAILQQQGPVLATRGNLNNDIGMPLTLLRLRDERFAVLELGANHPGEIAYLTRIAAPDVAVITNAGAAHLEGFGGLDGVARAKGEILAGLTEAGTAVLNADDPYLGYWRQQARDRRVLTFGFAPDADVRTEPARAETRWTAQGFQTRIRVSSPAGAFSLELQLGGAHNLRNALAASAACLALDLPAVSIQRGLAGIQPVAGRLQTRLAPSGVRVIDDSYNANPDSMNAAIAVLQSAPGRRWLVMGDLAELGGSAARLHSGIGERARSAGIERLWCCGPLSRAAVEAFGPQGRHFADREALAAALRPALAAGDTILVKGSRSAGMEQVVAALLEREGD
jgi:UDP-N-acetylmuramoyl-tripeptide--D-alanyl-D-alanine ligase